MKTSILILGALLFALAAPAAAQTVVNSWSTGGVDAAGLGYDPRTDTIWVADQALALIQQFGRNGVLLSSFPSPGPSPVGVGFDWSRGHLWIGDATGQVDEMTWSGFPTGLSFPTIPYVTDVGGVAFLPGLDYVFVSQGSFPQVVVAFDRSGSVVRQAPLAGAGSVSPRGLALNWGTKTGFLGDAATGLAIDVDVFASPVGSWNLAAAGINTPVGLAVDESNITVFVSGGTDATVYEVLDMIGGDGGFTLYYTGRPGGPMGFHAFNGTPKGPLHGLYSSYGRGSHPFLNPTTGNTLITGLSSLGFRFHVTVTADSAGNFLYTASVPSYCWGWSVQAIDGLTDRRSNVLDLR